MVKLIETVYNFLWGDLLTAPLGAALGCMDFKAAIMVIGLIILDMVLYYPFFKLLEKQKLEEENSVQTN